VLVSKGFRVFGSVRKQADADRLQKEFGNAFVPLVVDPIFWTKNSGFLDGLAALKMKESQCPKRVRVIRPA
jgi:hypothetical protein